jgi:DNA (cytosine-5)-methyltransferase 1
LDGSPPCSSFSMAGSREKGWGKEKVFREGQSMQVLDTLFFDFIDLAKELQPKVIIAENVKGLILGNAKKYVNLIYKAFDLAGFTCQLHLLNAAIMGVPQRRERVFFICMRKDLANGENYPNIDLNFCEELIPFSEIQTKNGPFISKFYTHLWTLRKKGDLNFSSINKRYRNKSNTGFGQRFIYKDKVVGSLTSKLDCMVKFDYPQYLSNNERCKIGSFPLDYNFNGSSNHYLIGMSVPPVMAAQIALRVYEQWLSKF